jgi:2-polyprenyl-6-methoxyphenol hydroxylase-like FAD-dependent oxidoreductase
MSDDVVPLSAACVVAGGGPAGIMAGYLLARAGVEVIVLEKHADFLRDFRGDTIHPSTLDVIAELGLLDEFLKRPHQEVRYAEGELGQVRLRFADFTHLPTRCKFVAFMPQWEFLNFIAEHARRLPTFRLLMSTEATDLKREDGRVVGLHARSPSGPIDIRADLVLGADGRHSRLRDAAGLAVRDLGAPMDVLWFRLSSKPGDSQQTGGVFLPGRIFVTLNRGDYWQCAYVIPKDSLEEVRRRGLDAFRADIARAVPDFADRVGEVTGWEQVKLLTVAVDRLNVWHKPGLLCIGDAAHAMSPIGGVGVNLAVQDAVAAANILAEPLRNDAVTDTVLQWVQDRRTFPTRATQRLQLFMQNNVISAVLSDKDELEPPLVLRLLARFPILRRIPARLLGLGFRPEHIHTPERAG